MITTNAQPTVIGNDVCSAETTTRAKSPTAAPKRTSTRTTSNRAAETQSSAAASQTELLSVAPTTTTSTTSPKNGCASRPFSKSTGNAASTAPEVRNRVITKWNPDYVLEYFKKVGIKDRCIVEYRFHPVRRWRFDYAFPDKRVYLEVDGGIFPFYVTDKTTGERKLIIGGHNYGGQIRNEHAKRNAATTNARRYDTTGGV